MHGSSAERYIGGHLGSDVVDAVRYCSSKMPRGRGFLPEAECPWPVGSAGEREGVGAPGVQRHAARTGQSSMEPSHRQDSN